MKKLTAYFPGVLLIAASVGLVLLSDSNSSTSHDNVFLNNVEALAFPESGGGVTSNPNPCDEWIFNTGNSWDVKELVLYCGDCSLVPCTFSSVGNVCYFR